MHVLVIVSITKICVSANKIHEKYMSESKNMI